MNIRFLPILHDCSISALKCDDDYWQAVQPKKLNPFMSVLTDGIWFLVHQTLSCYKVLPHVSSWERRSTKSTGPGGSLLIKVQASRRLIPVMLTPWISTTSSPGHTLPTGPPGTED